MIVESAPLSVLLLAAAGVGALHTLLGPDHYLPLIGLAREGRWKGRRVVAITTLAGLLHCATSALLVPLAAVLADGAASMAGVQDARGSLAAYLLVGLGAVLAVAAWRRNRAPADAPAGRRFASPLLLAAFALGPCEWLIPGAMAAAVQHGAAGAALTALAFTAATVVTMLVAVALGLRLLPRGLRLGGYLPAVACSLAGGLILAGL